jgi:glucose dehydrogenase
MDLLIPPLSALFLALGLLLIASRWLCPFMSLPLGFALAGLVCYVASGLLLRKAPLAVWLYLIAAPFFILWKIPLYLKILKGGADNEWIRTKRKAERRQND